ncbi:MAG: T9SS type A sorting domain-containing protein [Bacteroidia bacterium]
MKKITKNLLILASAFQLGQMNAQTVPVLNVQDSIFTNTHWTCDKQYLLKGYVYVTNGTTLTIDSGVIIKGDKNTKGSLIIERGAKIYANGTVNHPIVFTSNQAAGNRTYGDWGGLILCGYAPANWTSGQGQVEGGPRSLYGGNNPHDNSGKLSFVRCEFAGIAFSPNNEINGITFCGVGDGTQVDHLQVSYSGDDSYEWFGGNVNAKYMVSYRGWDDDFDTDNDFSGRVQFGVILRDPYSADQSGSKGFESDSYQSGTKTGLAGDTSGLTKPVFSNITAIGPMVNPTSTAYDPQFVAGAHIRRGSAISIMNSIIAGWPCGILFDESSSSFGSTTRNLRIMGAAGDSILQIRNTVICGIPTTNTPNRKEVEYVIDGARSLTPTNVEADTTTGNPFQPGAGPFSFLTAAMNKNVMYPTEQTGMQLSNPFNLSVPNFVPNSTSPLCYNSTALPVYVKNHYLPQTDHFGNGNVYPFNPALPINTDTSNFFANYNAPKVIPGFSSSRLKGTFFTKVNYVGAFSGTHTTADNWMATWTNFDPVNTDYSMVCATGIKENAESMYLQTFPNPATESVNVNFSLNEPGDVILELTDILGHAVETVKIPNVYAGLNVATISTTNLPQGTYFVKFSTRNITKSTKLIIAK